MVVRLPVRQRDISSDPTSGPSFLSYSRFVQLLGPLALNVQMGVRILHREPVSNLFPDRLSGRPEAFEGSNELGSILPPRVKKRGSYSGKYGGLPNRTHEFESRSPLQFWKKWNLASRPISSTGRARVS